MAKTILNLRLYYQGKLLDVAKYGRDFTDKLYIGSSKYLFWQILNKKFPPRHLFLRHKNDAFYLELLSGMQAAFMQGDQAIDTAALKNRNLMVGNELRLADDMTGSIALDNDWKVTYEFIEPYIQTYTKEERQIISEYSQRSALEPFQKFTRNFLLAALGVTILGIIVFDTIKPKMVMDNTLAEHWKQIESVATKVEIPPSASRYATSEAANKSIPQSVVKGAVPSTNINNRNRSVYPGSISALFGSGAGGGGLYAVTTEEDIIATSLGGGGGGSGSSSSNGKDTGGRGRGNGPGGGGGIANDSSLSNLFNPTDAPSGTANLSGLSTGRPQANLSTQTPGGNVTSYVGNAQRIAPVGRPAVNVSSYVVSRFSGPSVKRIKEGGAASAPPDTRSEIELIEQSISRYKPQIRDLYNRYSQIKSMYGTINYLVYIDTDGSVAGARITPVSGEFYPEFLSQLERLIRNWHFDSKHLVPYEFIMTFTQ